MEALSTFMERSKTHLKEESPIAPRTYIMDELYESQRNESLKKLDKATKYLRNLSFDEKDENFLSDKIDEAQNNYNLFHKNIDDEEEEKKVREKKRNQQKITVNFENLSKESEVNFYL